MDILTILAIVVLVILIIILLGWIVGWSGSAVRVRQNTMGNNLVAIEAMSTNVTLTDATTAYIVNNQRQELSVITTPSPNLQELYNVTGTNNTLAYTEGNLDANAFYSKNGMSGSSDILLLQDGVLSINPKEGQSVSVDGRVRVVNVNPQHLATGDSFMLYTTSTNTKLVDVNGGSYILTQQSNIIRYDGSRLDVIPSYATGIYTYIVAGGSLTIQPIANLVVYTKDSSIRYVTLDYRNNSYAPSDVAIINGGTNTMTINFPSNQGANYTVNGRSIARYHQENGSVSYQTGSLVVQ